MTWASDSPLHCRRPLVGVLELGQIPPDGSLGCICLTVLYQPNHMGEMITRTYAPVGIADPFARLAGQEPSPLSAGWLVMPGPAERAYRVALQDQRPDFVLDTGAAKSFIRRSGVSSGSPEPNMARAAGIGFVKEGNCFTDIADPQVPAQVADALSQPAAMRCRRVHNRKEALFTRRSGR